LQRKNPRKISWTVLFRRMHKKGISEEVAKKRTRRTVKHQRAVVGASWEAIRAKRNQKPEVRAAARAAALRDGKEKKKADESNKKAEKAKVRDPNPTESRLYLSTMRMLLTVLYLFLPCSYLIERPELCSRPTQGLQAGRQGCQDQHPQHFSLNLTAWENRINLQQKLTYQETETGSRGNAHWMSTFLFFTKEILFFCCLNYSCHHHSLT